MGISDPGQHPVRQREQFRLLRQLLEAARSGGLDVDTLSMGMSDDLELAIEEGATMVRVGTALFGARRREAGEGGGANV
jgi:uncharacterized pyridoxal phosphate-containing UPF0001 family protein